MTKIESEQSSCRIVSEESSGTENDEKVSTGPEIAGSCCFWRLSLA